MPLHYLTVAHAPNSFVIQLSSEEQDLFSFTGKMYLQYTCILYILCMYTIIYSVPEQQDLGYLVLFSVIPLRFLYVCTFRVQAFLLAFCNR